MPDVDEDRGTRLFLRWLRIVFPLFTLLSGALLLQCRTYIALIFFVDLLGWALASCWLLSEQRDINIERAPR